MECGAREPRCRDENLSRLIREDIRAIPDIVSTKTTIVLQTTKESTILPLNSDETEKDEKKKDKGKRKQLK